MPSARKIIRRFAEKTVYIFIPCKFYFLKYFLLSFAITIKTSNLFAGFLQNFMCHFFYFLLTYKNKTMYSNNPNRLIYLQKIPKKRGGGTSKKNKNKKEKRKIKMKMKKKREREKEKEERKII